MKKLLAQLAFVLALWGPLPALAATPNKTETQPVLAAAVPQAMTMLVGLCAYSVYNGDTASIYWGFNASVNASTGFPIVAGGLMAWTITYQSAQSGTTIYLFSTAGTSANKVLWKAAC